MGNAQNRKAARGSRSGKYHIVWGEGFVAACNPYGAALRGPPVPAGTVPMDERCSRPGCRKRWNRLTLTIEDVEGE